MMLDRTTKKIQSYYDNELQAGADGQRHQIDRVTRINPQQCECLHELHRNIKPDLSVETGLAYGFSTLAFLDAMAQGEYGHHIAIDPVQIESYKGVGCAAVDELGFSNRFTWIKARSDKALADLIEQKRRVQLAYYDGCHWFEAIIVDLALTDQMLDVGGIIVVNDMWMPVIRSVRSFVASNWQHYEQITGQHDNLFVMRKNAEDHRAWDHFAPFDGQGQDIVVPEKKASFGLFRNFARR